MQGLYAASVTETITAKKLIILLEWTGRMQHVDLAFSFVWTHKLLE
jgi:hypothetical protein